MKHPMRFVDANLRRVKAGSRALGKRLSEAGERLVLKMEPRHGHGNRSLAAELLERGVRRLLTTAMELGVSLLLRRLFPQRRLATVHPFPVPTRPAR